jgi:hypothetical protein
VTRCVRREAADRPFRKSPDNASRGAKAIECNSPSRQPHSRESVSKSAAIWSSDVTSHASTGHESKPAASFVTRGFNASLAYVNASVAPSR